jgi:ABC-type taurine transport system ATPase subunit
VRSLDEVLDDTARCFRMRGRSRLVHLVLRGASPQIAAGARQALSIGIILMVISEMFAASNGLGFTIIQFQRGLTRADLEDLVRALWKRLGVTVLFVTHDIDEAVYLGQRVLVLSTSPTVVLEDVVIDLPAERDQLTIRSLPRFAELRGHVYRLVQQAKRGGGAAASGPPGRATEAM